jgi:hypothetical protein
MRSLADIRRMVEAGHTKAHMMRETGFDWTMLQRRLDMLGLQPVRGREEYSDTENETLQRMMAEGAPAREIAAELPGRSPSSVIARAKKMNLVWAYHARRNGQQHAP